MVLAGKSYVVLEQSEYEELRAAAGHREDDLPPLPDPINQADDRPALEYTRVLLARKIILARRAKGWTQKQLAGAAGVRTETVNRIENGKHTPDLATVDKIDAALTKK